jgi:hypothetical protein
VALLKPGCGLAEPFEFIQAEIIDALRNRRGDAVQDQAFQPSPICRRFANTSWFIMSSLMSNIGSFVEITSGLARPQPSKAWPTALFRASRPAKRLGAATFQTVETASLQQPAFPLVEIIGQKGCHRQLSSPGDQNAVPVLNVG